ncbi:MAG: hypothetical protein AAGI13_01610 [Pseudomonadota bacterium]
MRTLGRIIKFLILIGVLGVAGLAGYALLFDLPPPVREQMIDLPLPEPN